jgi:phage terminase large subunit-like protein
MAVLATGDITLPRNIAAGLFQRAQTGSTVGALSGQIPMQFGDVDFMTFTTPPRAQYVGEGAQKASSTVGFDVVTATPKKVQVTLRFNEEVLWADEDYQLGILRTAADACGDALARALDLGVYHGVNPLTGTATALIPAGQRVATTTNRVTTAGGDGADLEVESAAGLVIASGYRPTGIAFDPTHAWTLSTARYDDGRKKYPELGLGVDVTAFEGLRASTSSTVSGQPEAADTRVRAILGQWDLLRWGVQRNVPVETIRFGDPDGQGDLKRTNQVAIRLEVVYGWGIMDLDGFSVIETAP